MACLVCQGESIACKSGCVFKQFFNDAPRYQSFKVILGCISSGYMEAELEGLIAEEGSKLSSILEGKS